MNAIIIFRILHRRDSWRSVWSCGDDLVSELAIRQDISAGKKLAAITNYYTRAATTFANAIDGRRANGLGFIVSSFSIFDFDSLRDAGF